MMGDSSETVSDDRRVYLYPHSIIGCAPEPLDIEVLFHPFEEQLDLPSVFIYVGNLLIFRA